MLNEQLNKISAKHPNNHFNNKPLNNPILPIRKTGPQYAITPQAINCNEYDAEEDLKEYLIKKINERGPTIAAFNYGQGGPTNSATNTSTSSATSNVTTSTPTVGFTIYSFYFDSIARNPMSNYNKGEIQWDIQSLNNNNQIHNIVGITIKSFLFPNLNLNSTNPNIFYFSRLFMDIYSLPSGYGILAENTTRFHFEFSVSNLNSQAVLLTPIKDTFYITYPILYLNSFTVRFMINNMTPGVGGFTYLQLPLENVTITSTLSAGVGSNPMVFSINGANTTILAAIGVLPINQGIAVFISNFNSTDTNLNYQVNSPSGLYITTIIDINTFSISTLNGSGITASYTANMYIPKNKISLTTDFISVDNAPTNHIMVTI